MNKRLRSMVIVLCSAAVLWAAVALQAPSSPPDEAEARLPAGAAAPRYFKGNLHTHSLWSDGDDFPEMIADWYKRHGYQFLGLSDHNVLSEGERWVDEAAETTPRGQALRKYRARFGDRWVERRHAQGKAQVRLKPLREFRSLLEEPGRFLLIPAEEISHRFAKAPVHMNAVNLRDVIKPSDGDSIAETIRVNMRAVAEQRKRTGWHTIVFLNHPNFGWGIRAEDMVLTGDVRFFEIFNGHPSVRNYGDEVHVGCERMWDIVLALRVGKYGLPMVYGMATDDAHGYHAFGLGKVNPGRAWVMVRAPHLSAEAIVHALEAGDFYLSTGVVLDDVRLADGEVRLAIRAEEGVKYKTQFIATHRDADLQSEARADKDGNEVTRLYSHEIGKVIADSDDLKPSYRLTGKEWYVRAKVISSKPHPNPYQKGDVEVAWTQPFVP